MLLKTPFLSQHHPHSQILPLIWTFQPVKGTCNVQCYILFLVIFLMLLCHPITLHLYLLQLYFSFLGPSQKHFAIKIRDRLWQMRQQLCILMILQSWFLFFLASLQLVAKLWLLLNCPLRVLCLGRLGCWQRETLNLQS